MPKTIETQVFTYDELPTEKAKERAMQWLLECGYGGAWRDCIYEDAENIGLKITSFDLDRNRHAKGEFITSAPECAEAILREHGKTCDTYTLARNYLDDLAALGDRPSDKDENADDGKWEDTREELDNEFLRALLEDYASTLEKQSEYLSSREYLEESIRANEYTFTEDGKRFG